MKCSVCEGEIARGNHWEEIKGWKQRRTGGGTNHVALQSHTGRVMCAGCMHLAKSGTNVGQGKLA